MSKPLSKSHELIGKMHLAALAALAAAPQGQLKRPELMAAIEKAVPLDEWAKHVYESGNTRWRSIFAFSSVGMSKAGYITKNKGVWSICPEGRRVLAEKYDAAQIVQEVNTRYDDWQSAQLANSSSEAVTAAHSEAAHTAEQEEIALPPDERISKIMRTVNHELSAEILETIKQGTPEFFENLVVQLMLAMGYGGSRQEAGRAIGKTGDNGVDGVIHEDRLGLEAIYLQAKKWENPVGEREIRDFKGALDAKGAKKGVFITTSSFTPAAKEAAKTSHSYKVVLIDGAKLAELMINHNLGVSVFATYELKKIDTDYFSED